MYSVHCNSTMLSFSAAAKTRQPMWLYQSKIQQDLRDLRDLLSKMGRFIILETGWVLAACLGGKILGTSAWDCLMEIGVHLKRNQETGRHSYRLVHLTCIALPCLALACAAVSMHRTRAIPPLVLAAQVLVCLRFVHLLCIALRCLAMGSFNALHTLVLAAQVLVPQTNMPKIPSQIEMVYLQFWMFFCVFGIMYLVIASEHTKMPTKSKVVYLKVQLIPSLNSSAKSYT